MPTTTNHNPEKHDADNAKKTTEGFIPGGES